MAASRMLPWCGLGHLTASGRFLSNAARKDFRLPTFMESCPCARPSRQVCISRIARFPSTISSRAKGLRAALGCLTQARYGIGWGVLGAAMDCYETARSYTLTRKQFDNRPIASHQLVQEKLAWMITEITKAQLLAMHVGKLKDQDRADPRTFPC